MEFKSRRELTNKVIGRKENKKKIMGYHKDTHIYIYILCKYLYT